MNLETANAITASLSDPHYSPRNERERRDWADLTSKTLRQNLSETLHDMAVGKLAAQLIALVVQATEGGPAQALQAAELLGENLACVLGAAADMLKEADGHDG